MRNIRLDLCYDGTRYRGWQRQPGVENTVQGKLEQTLSRLLEEPVEIFGSGRTDAGVHAIGQVANFHCSSQLQCSEVLSELRRHLPEDIGIYSCREVPDRFHARLNAKAKTYRYRIWNSDMPCVFDRRYVTEFPEPLDIQAMKAAAEYFLGQHDFSAFYGNRSMKKSTVRQIFSLDIIQSGHEVQFLIKGNGFLRNMVRIMVGTLLEVGAGSRAAEDVPALFGQKREQAGFLAPAKGLCLMEVYY